MNDALAAYHTFVAAVRYLLFWIAFALAVVALVDWAVRTRKLNPFSAVARFFRRFVDPFLAPLEGRIVRRGGLPSTAPWWALAVVVVGGILLVALLNFLGGFATEVVFGLSSPGRFGALLISWSISLLRIALIARVISSWIQISPYSKWIRWSFVLTEWMLAPLRRVIPTFGPMDVTPLVAFFLLALIGSVLGVR